ncbi:hypothetical protein JIN84_01800 [Luteolibacter yonseiensis]|uniref:Uncharacterized protein n=1 Tax=Luteolibacter yonseiensis TaxID=1144680 RepID=A0A934V5U7_9BACT|nr:hypothetical protein [Luteolibacter yonseiensis]MBK1814327.1 hypothetical protein [Luteolibacter yonseiensis]
MHLPTPQFSRLVTALAFDLNNPLLDSMILAWDHIATRFLNRLANHREAAGKVESIRLLAIHDGIHAVLGSGNGYMFHGLSSGSSTSAALAATAQASHDVLAAVFDLPEDREDLAHLLEESLSLISDPAEAVAGVITGAASAGTYEREFAPLTLEDLVRDAAKAGRIPRRPLRVVALAEKHDHDGWRRSA